MVYVTHDVYYMEDWAILADGELLYIQNKSLSMYLSIYQSIPSTITRITGVTKNHLSVLKKQVESLLVHKVGKSTHSSIH